MNSYQGQYFRDAAPDSTITKVERHYWITKQNVFKKIGKKEDDCVVACDAELDAKLELFRSIQDSCLELHKIIDQYQERICCLAQEQNSMGRFLKEAGKIDKTRAGKMMTNVGKSLSFSGQQQLILRTPLLRLSQEVETFRQRAISDTLSTLKAMEKQRIEYRAALSWMKDVSQELDPEKHLDKFRKVQGQVRRSKMRFDKSKLDCLQKIDLLAAARCNMFSHALVLYHNNLLQYCEKTSNAYLTIANSFKGYQHYDFCVIKELAEPSLKLAEQLQTNENKPSEGESEKQEEDKDILLFFDSEYKDVASEEKKSLQESKKINPEECAVVAPVSQPLLDLENLTLTNETSDSSNGIQLLGDIFADKGIDENWSKEWEELFQVKDESAKSFSSKEIKEELCGEIQLTSNDNSNCLPSTLLNKMQLRRLQPEKFSAQDSSLQMPQKNPKSGKDMSTWFSLFADLDPLADPDAVGKKLENSDQKVSPV
ncbi:Islet cell autoantigen, putative [Pediculus humanus corporis]|uniref:Islet cell autoantigen, putative n=1 Tax=Pediculus humanus subsp. corporis TaxID=121224 RepID=E0VGK0_PEDHC|nr:Islet cell autoantigen, putative [Pediculus humanus corporis]EEB12506.1 Islet cell autoantigen, putative [Pediculus humanus corporis]